MLNLRYPTRITAEGPPPDKEVAPRWLMVHYEYPARKEMPPVKLTWYHGEKRPPQFPMRVPADLPGFTPWWEEPEF